MYYEPYLRELVTGLPLVARPGARFKYNSYNPVLVGLALERQVFDQVAVAVSGREG